MNTQAIKEFALEAYRKDKDDEDNWVAFSDDWDINIYQPEWDETIVKCVVFPVIDGVIDSSVDVYSFEFPREV